MSLTQEDTSKEFGISVKQLRDIKRLQTLTHDF